MKTSSRGFKKIQVERVTNELGQRVWIFDGKQFPAQRDLRDYIIKSQEKVTKPEVTNG